jgi:excisionase family DNA binding protein
METKQNQLLTTKQAAEILNLKKCTLEAWRHRGGGPSYARLGRAVRYRLSDLEKFIQAQVRHNTSEA